MSIGTTHVYKSGEYKYKYIQIQIRHFPQVSGSGLVVSCVNNGSFHTLLPIVGVVVCEKQTPHAGQDKT